ncbi:MAG TPA: hypothetical protein VGR70_11570 [Stellaceae bacterium]|nr:hypothetical protein [Stellaceae bacterium]
MTAAILHTDLVPPRQGWRALLWIAPLTALWIALNYAVPIIPASGMSTVAVRVFIHVLIGLGLWLGLERAELTPVQRRKAWLGVMIPFTLWLGLIWSSAINGVFRGGVTPIPLLPFAIFLPVIIGAPIMLLSKRMGQVLDAMPATWLIALQLYRVLGSGFLIGWAVGVVPGVFALPAGIGDVTTGLLAVPVAISLAAGTLEGRKAAVAWNIFGLLDFAVAVSIGLMISPGPLQLIVPSIPNAAGGLYPNVMIPAFAVPSSILLHVLSLRQLRRRSR